MKNKIVIGLLVNPWAGIGGEVALKGSDGDSIRKQALDLGAQLNSEKKVSHFLQKLKAIQSELSFLSCPAFMGEHVLKEAGFDYQLIESSSTHTPKELSEYSGIDSQYAAEKIAAAGVDILIFAGGDGTARDVAKGLSEHPKQLCLGIPTGVKIHSGVFARSPIAAADMLIAMTQQVGVDICMAEVRDIDEAALRQGRVESRYFSELKVLSVPNKGLSIQNSKQGKSQLSAFEIEQELLVAEEIATCLKERFLSEQTKNLLLIVGSGKTTHAFKRIWSEDFDEEQNLLSVDIFLNSRYLKRDVSEEDILTLFQLHPDYVNCCRVVVSVIGGQGFIFGRGSQPISAKVLKCILDARGKEAIVVIASKNKIVSLPEKSLFVDTGDSLVDARLSGSQSVLVDYEQEMLCQVRC